MTEPKHTPFAAIGDLREANTVLVGMSRAVTPSVLTLREAVCRIDRAASGIEMEAKDLLADNERLREQVEAAEGCFQAASGVVNDLQAENKRLREALRSYAECGDGCTCGDGWSHDIARAALAL